MIVGRIEGATRFLGAPVGWDKDRDGPCGCLPIRDGTLSGYRAMTSSWELTPQEVALIVAGAPIHLTVLGTSHPPVAMSIGTPPHAG